MSKTRNKSHSEVKHLRGIVKKLQSQNRQLRKELNYYKKRSHFYEETITEAADESLTRDEQCPHCGKGVITELDLVHIIVRSCNVCDHKERIKPRK